MRHWLRRGPLCQDRNTLSAMQVENPLAFAPDQATRVLSTAYLHALYSLLLLAPWRLSCDWSYACVPLVERLTGGCFCLHSGHGCRGKQTSQNRTTAPPWWSASQVAEAWPQVHARFRFMSLCRRVEAWCFGSC